MGKRLLVRRNHCHQNKFCGWLVRIILRESTLRSPKITQKQWLLSRLPATPHPTPSLSPSETAGLCLVDEWFRTGLGCHNDLALNMPLSSLIGYLRMKGGTNRQDLASTWPWGSSLTGSAALFSPSCLPTQTHTASLTLRADLFSRPGCLMILYSQCPVT